MNLEELSVIFQFVETTAVVVALVYAWLQIRDSRKSAKTEAAWEMFKELCEDDVRSARYFVYQNKDLYKALVKDGSNLNTLSKEASINAQKVSNSLDRIGFLVRQGLVPENLILEGYSHVVGRSWIALEPWLNAVRSSRNEPSFQSYFEYLANLAFKDYVKREEIKFV